MNVNTITTSLLPLSSKVSEITPLIISSSDHSTKYECYSNDDNIQHDSSTTTTTTITQQQNGQPITIIPIPTSMDVLNHSRLLLYISHFFAQCSESVWQFALLLFLGAFVNYQSLLYVSTYGLISNCIVFIFGSHIGHIFIDQSKNRIISARILIWTENICVIIASILCYLLFNNNDNTSSLPTDYYSIIILIGIHIFGSIAQLLDRGFTISMERDWVVIMGEVASSNYYIQQRNDYNNEKDISSTSSSSSSSWLLETNVRMKQIDLSCKVLSPAIAGFLIEFFSDNNGNNNNLSFASIVVGVINVLSLIVEYICTTLIYNHIPELTKKPKIIVTTIDVKETNDSVFDNKNNSSNSNGNSNGNINNIKDENNNHSIITNTIIPKPLSIYMEQPISLAGISLSLLYLNSLTFGGVMTSYLLYRGMSIPTVGMCRGISAAIGLLGTFVYQISSNRMNIISTGMWSIIFQFIFISCSMISMFINDFIISMSLMVIGVCVSRIGLYVFDISITQLMQMNVPDGIRGIMGGIQESLNSFFQLSAFGLCLIYTNPKDFIITVAAGYIAVAIAVLLYGFGIYIQSSKFICSIISSNTNKR